MWRAQTLGTREKDISFFYVRAGKTDAQLVAHVQSLRALRKHSFAVGLGNAHESSMLGHAGHKCVEDFADAVLDGHSRKPLRHVALDFLGCAFFRSTIRRDGAQLSIG